MGFGTTSFTSTINFNLLDEIQTIKYNICYIIDGFVAAVAAHHPREEVQREGVHKSLREGRLQRGDPGVELDLAIGPQAGERDQEARDAQGRRTGAKVDQTAEARGRVVFNRPRVDYVA